VSKGGCLAVRQLTLWLKSISTRENAY